MTTKTCLCTCYNQIAYAAQTIAGHNVWNWKNGCLCCHKRAANSTLIRILFLIENHQVLHKNVCTKLNVLKKTLNVKNSWLLFINKCEVFFFIIIALWHGNCIQEVNRIQQTKIKINLVVILLLWGVVSRHYGARYGNFNHYSLLTNENVYFTFFFSSLI